MTDIVLQGEQAVLVDAVVAEIKQSYARIDEEKQLINDYLAESAEKTGLPKALIRQLARHSYKKDIEDKVKDLEEKRDILKFIDETVNSSSSKG